MLHGKSGILPVKATTSLQSTTIKWERTSLILPSPGHLTISMRRKVLSLSGEWLVDALSDDEVIHRTRRFIVPASEWSEFMECLRAGSFDNSNVLGWWGVLR